MAVQIDGSQGSVIATSGTYSGGVSIGGTLTYEDVTNIDAVGLITARNGIEIGSRPGVAASISVDGNMIVSGISTFKDIVYVADKILHDGDGNTGIRFPVADNIAFTTSGSEAVRIDSSGRVNIGNSSNRTVWGGQNALQIEGLDGAAASATIIRNSNDVWYPWLGFGKSRGTSDGASTIVQDDDCIGAISWNAADGTDMTSQGAAIYCDIDGTPGSNDTPARLEFHTCADGASTPTERLRIASDGEVFIGPAASAISDRSTLLSITGAHQSPSGVWTQVGVYSNDSQAADKGGSIGFGGQDGSTTKQQFAAILGAKENGTSTNYAGYLSVYTRPAGSTSVERLRITSTGHMGLGVIPSAWPANGDSRGLQVGTGACLFGRGSGDEDRGGIGVNYYNDGSGNKYIANGNASRIYMNDGNIDFDYGATNSSGAGAALSLTTHMRIATDGDVAIGHYSPSARLDVRSASNNGRTLLMLQNDDSSNYGQLTIELGKTDREVRFVGGYNDNFMTFYTQASGSSTERMRIDKNGVVLIGRTSAGNTGNGHSLRGTDSCIFSRDSDGGETIQVSRNTNDSHLIQFRAGDSGNASQIGHISKSGSGVTYNSDSDYRKKENDVVISDGITKLKQLRPIRFNFKDRPDKTLDGFFAHEVHPVVPEIVTGTKDAVVTQDDIDNGYYEQSQKDDPKYQSMDYGRLTPLLTAALQEAIAKIEVLESEVAALKSS